MIITDSFKGQKIAVMGLARSGIASVESLVAGGAHVLAWDDNADRRQQAAAAGAEIVELVGIDWSQVSALVLSPGIPHTYPTPHPVATAARGAGVEIIGDIELLLRARPAARIVAITGTNGKSTTTALLGHILETAGLPCAIGGNLGDAALGLADPGPDGVWVLEFSSYQLELTPSLAPEAAVLLTITPDHLDRHGGMDGYIAAKKRVLAKLGAASIAVIGVDDEICHAIHAETHAEIGDRALPVSGIGQELHDAPALPGSHNALNAGVASAIARHLGVDQAQIDRAFTSFPGLPHRQEFVARINHVDYVNDSKATNAEAAARALACYERIYWIAGGQAKDGGIASLKPYFPRLSHAYLIGASAQDFAKDLEGQTDFTVSGDLEVAVRHAHHSAQSAALDGSVVLLSPAAASFDQFASFEARGDQFRDLVAALAQSSSGPAMAGGAA
jgi:UDP-N-acetylmuramoylalanine--D-glutamate ligase